MSTPGGPKMPPPISPVKFTTLNLIQLLGSFPLTINVQKYCLRRQREESQTYMLQIKFLHIHTKNQFELLHYLQLIKNLTCENHRVSFTENIRHNGSTLEI